MSLHRSGLRSNDIRVRTVCLGMHWRYFAIDFDENLHTYIVADPFAVAPFSIDKNVENAESRVAEYNRMGKSILGACSFLTLKFVSSECIPSCL